MVNKDGTNANNNTTILDIFKIYVHLFQHIAYIGYFYFLILLIRQMKTSTLLARINHGVYISSFTVTTHSVYRLLFIFCSHYSLCPSQQPASRRLVVCRYGDRANISRCYTR